MITYRGARPRKRVGVHWIETFMQRASHGSCAGCIRSALELHVKRQFVYSFVIGQNGTGVIHRNTRDKTVIAEMIANNCYEQALPHIIALYLYQ